MKKLLLSVILLTLAGVANLNAAGILYGVAVYNVFTFQNFTDSNSDVEGGLAVGGSATITGFSVAANLSNLTPFNPFGGYTLIGDSNLIAGSGSLVSGKVYDGTAGGGGISSNFTIDGMTPTDAANAGDLITGGTNPVDFSTYASEIQNYSSGTMANSGQTNGTAGDSCTVAYGAVTCNALQAGVNTIYVSGSTLANATSGYNIDSSVAGATVIIDITGTSDSLTSSGWTFNGISAQNVILNFYQATALSFNGSVPLSVLAPYAAVTGSNGVLTGNLIADSFTSSDYQFNSANFTGSLPTPSGTPEPTSLALIAAGLLSIGAVRRARHASRRE